MGFDVLFVSPHPDDVAFSAAGQVAREVTAGRRVAVLTLFDRSSPSGGAGFVAETTRSAEDQAFAGCAGVERIAGGLVDALARRRRYRAPRRLLAPLHPDEAPLVSEVRARLEEVLAGGCRRLVAPLGIGEHADHQIAHQAARQLDAAAVDVSFYEDTPHVLTPFQLARRLARLGCRPPEGDATILRGTVGEELGALWRTWSAMPFIDALLGVPQGARRSWLARLLRPLVIAVLSAPALLSWPRRVWGSTPVACELLAGADLLAAKLAAIACYGTQWPMVFPSLDLWRAALEGYARSLGQDGAVERVWRFVPPYAQPAPEEAA
jgi:LmbE family N-acetylglucosaminyl deacetylase